MLFGGEGPSHGVFALTACGWTLWIAVVVEEDSEVAPVDDGLM